MRFVLDNSVTMRWLFKDGSLKEQQYARDVLQAIQYDHVLVPAIWSLEVANVISRAERKYGLSEARSAEFIHILSQMHIRIDQETYLHALADTLQLARRYDLSSYDASYLELALREGIALATLDNALVDAMQRTGVKRFMVSI